MQWLRLCPSTAGDMSSIPGVGTRSHMPEGTAKEKKQKDKKKDNVAKQDELVWEVGGEFMEMVALVLDPEDETWTAREKRPWP